MQKSAKSRAEEQFTATQKKAMKVMSEIEKDRQERTDRMAKQKALRLAKLAVDNEAAALEAAAKAKPKKRAAKKT